MSVMMASGETTAKIADMIYRIVMYGYDQERIYLTRASQDYIQSIMGKVDSEREQRIYEALQSLYSNSYDTRYKQSVEPYEGEPYKPAHFERTEEFYKGENGHADYQKLKSIQFFNYQCSDHNRSPEAVKLYNVLAEIETGLINNIIGNMPEYQAAKWK